MPYPHVIRLRGPWQWQLVERAEDAEQQARAAGDDRRPVRLPCDWGPLVGPGFRGVVCFRRRFGRPTGLEPHERIWLVCEGVDARGQLLLNGQPVGAVGPFGRPVEFDVTERLDARNELALEVSLPPLSGEEARLLRPGRERLPGGPIGEVRLEIRSVAFIGRLAVFCRVSPEKSTSAELVVEGDALWPGVTTGSRPVGDTTERALPEAEISEAARPVIGAPANARVAADLALVAAAENRELLYAELPGVGSFQLAAPIELPPEWLAGQPNDRLLALEIALLAGGRRVWEARLETGLSRAQTADSNECLTVNGRTLRLPVPWAELGETEPDDEAVDRILERVPSPLVGVRRILPGAFYQACSRQGLAVIQFMPSWDWALEVCPRLAAYPAIVGWTMPAGVDRPLQSEQPSGVTPSEALWSRPWLPASALGGAATA